MQDERIHGVATLFDLYKVVGAKLSGRKIILRFVQPSRSDADGQVTRLTTGQALVEINPNVEADKEFFNFLHEIAHLKLHWDTLVVSEPRKAMSLLPKSVSRPKNYVEDNREGEANIQASLWNRYAELNYIKYEPGTKEALMLEALYYWKG